MIEATLQIIFKIGFTSVQEQQERNSSAEGEGWEHKGTTQQHLHLHRDPQTAPATTQKGSSTWDPEVEEAEQRAAHNRQKTSWKAQGVP